jgi:hypothetical protein
LPAGYEAAGKSVVINGRQTWDEEDLVRRLCHALDVAERAVAALSGSGYSDAANPNDAVRPEKVVAESALLLLAAHAVNRYSEVKKRIDGVAELLIPLARGKQMQAGVCLTPSLALDYGQAHLCLSRIGHVDESFDNMLRLAFSGQAGGARERLPHRQLEQEWLQIAWSPGRKCKSVNIRNSAIGRPLDLIGSNRDDFYAFTHALMYGTDLGVTQLRLPRSRTAISAEADAALAHCLDTEDYDLAGEVLLTWPMTGIPWSSVATFGFAVLVRVEDEAGFLPASTTRLEPLGKLEGSERDRYLLATGYHTVYVMGLLCAISLRLGRSPPIRVPVNLQNMGSADQWLRLLDRDVHPHWRDSFDLLATSDQDSLMGMLFGIALQRSVRKRRFEVTAQLLQKGYAEGLANVPVASQVAELLQRVKLLSE